MGMMGLRVVQLFILVALSRAGFMKRHGASTPNDAQIEDEALRQQVLQLRSQMEAVGERMNKLYGREGNLSTSKAAPGVQSWYVKFEAMVHAGGPMSSQLKSLEEAQASLFSFSNVISIARREELLAQRDQKQLLLGLLMSCRRSPFEKQLDALLSSAGDYKALPMLDMLKYLRKRDDFQTPVAIQVADYLDDHPEQPASPDTVVARSGKLLEAEKAAETQSGIAEKPVREAAAVPNKDASAMTQAISNLVRAKQVTAMPHHTHPVDAQALQGQKETEEPTKDFSDEVAQAEEEAMSIVAQAEDSQLQKQSLLAISLEAGRSPLQKGSGSTLEALQNHLSHLKDTVRQKLIAEKDQLNILLAASTRRKDSSADEARKLLLVAKAEGRIFSKGLAVDRERIEALQDAVDAVRSGNVKAVQAARKRIRSLQQEARLHRTNKFLVLLGIGQNSSSEDCPYCVAQCMEKCHTAGKSYVSCLTGCADAKTA